MVNNRRKARVMPVLDEPAQEVQTSQEQPEVKMEETTKAVAPQIVLIKTSSPKTEVKHPVKLETPKKVFTEPLFIIEE